MAGWAGFTDEDLRRMKQGSSADSAQHSQHVQAKRQRTPNRERVGSTLRTQSTGQVKNQVPLDPSQRLSQPQVKVTRSNVNVDNNVKDNGRSEVTENMKRTVDASQQKRNDEKKTDNMKVADQEEGTQDKTKVAHAEGEQTLNELDEKEARRVELDNEAKFLKQQKMIEEANKQKREYLAKTINERRKKAKAESVKLGKIQTELNRLDSLLSVDVSMIRDKIEAASLDYMEAQRRYNQAEQDFIKAKMVLFDKGEMKEKLTEHLYTIIHQNEVRKATKLAELMKQLEMEIAEDDIELGIPAIPMLTNFNSVTTLHNPVKSPVSPERGNLPSIQSTNTTKMAEAQNVKSESVKPDTSSNSEGLNPVESVKPDASSNSERLNPVESVKPDASSNSEGLNPVESVNSSTDNNERTVENTDDIKEQKTCTSDTKSCEKIKPVEETNNNKTQSSGDNSVCDVSENSTSEVLKDEASEQDSVKTETTKTGSNSTQENT